MTDNEEAIEEKIFFVKPQKIDLRNLNCKGRILDLGGGGEGIIGQLYENHVIAIDKNENELKEALGDFIKIIMDARDMKFLDESFDTVTSFFTLLYVPTSDRKKIFQEVKRVLKFNGEFIIWDLVIPNRNNNVKQLFGVRIEISMKDKKVSTGYATHWNKQQNLKYYLKLGKEIGFKVLECVDKGEIFYLKFQKTV
ncbi:MAG: class I SAM-dependent methyltransferase [Candidatus Thorarchaeota archaeon]